MKKLLMAIAFCAAAMFSLATTGAQASPASAAVQPLSAVVNSAAADNVHLARHHRRRQVCTTRMVTRCYWRWGARHCYRTPVRHCYWRRW